MKAQHGGVYQAAAAAKVHFTQVYAFLRGGSMSQENAGRLRSVVKADDSTWADAFAPVPPDDAAATEALA